MSSIRVVELVIYFIVALLLVVLSYKGFYKLWTLDTASIAENFDLGTLQSELTQDKQWADIAAYDRILYAVLVVVGALGTAHQALKLTSGSGGASWHSSLLLFSAFAVAVVSGLDLDKRADHALAATYVLSVGSCHAVANNHPEVAQNKSAGSSKKLPLTQIDRDILLRAYALAQSAMLGDGKAPDLMKQLKPDSAKLVSDKGAKGKAGKTLMTCALTHFN